jgi:alkanesulfonate monooxygenase SsuD/methylene tetrahydromethanopterin reductase-like flavin-dependent oxidoreductase (luciferase family)
MGPNVTVGEAAIWSSCGLAPHIVGTPVQVADQLEELFEGAGGDGFVFMSDYSPKDATALVDLLVPELQQRGRFREDYTAETFRGHLLEY